MSVVFLSIFLAICCQLKKNSLSLLRKIRESLTRSLLMKRFENILLSSLLSFLIIYLGVGVPFVQYSCASCAGAQDGVRPLLVLSEVSDGGCQCGCSDPNRNVGATATKTEAVTRTAETSCCCGDVSGGCCSHNSEQTACCGNSSNDKDFVTTENASSKTNTGSCQKVRIEKINLPVLTDGVHLDNVQMPAIDFLFSALIVPEINNNKFQNDRTCYNGAPPFQKHPRTYINFICTLLI